MYHKMLSTSLRSLNKHVGISAPSFLNKNGSAQKQQPKATKRNYTTNFVRPPPCFDSKISISLAMTFDQHVRNDKKTTNEAVKLPSTRLEVVEANGILCEEGIFVNPQAIAQGPLKEAMSPFIYPYITVWYNPLLYPKQLWFFHCSCILTRLFYACTINVSAFLPALSRYILDTSRCRS